MRTLLTTDMGSAMATTPRPICTQSQAMPARPASALAAQMVWPEAGPGASPVSSTCVPRCSKRARGGCPACHNKGGQARKDQAVAEGNMKAEIEGAEFCMAFILAIRAT